MRTPAERLRSSYEALSRDGDFSAIFDEFDPDVELHQSEEGPEGLIVHRGLEGLAGWREAMASAWEDISYELLEFEQEGDRVLAIVRRSVRGRTSDLAIEQTLAHIFTLGANDKVVRIDAFLDPEQARAALRESR